MDALDTNDILPISRLKQSTVASRPQFWRAIGSWLLAWEIYPILFLATFLRLYHPGIADFDADQAAILGMARNAVTHGLLPITTNTASIGIVNPPATVYLLMLGAVFSANPLTAIVVTVLFNIIAVFLTYAVVRRYYGRVAATVAGLLYAVSNLAAFYGRFPWNQNLLAPFVPLFLFALFWGVVERRRGWLAPAVLLWGWMIQLHGSAVFLAVPLLLACVLAFKTLRWRDIFLAAALLLLIYAPYMIWEYNAHFTDIHILLQSLRQKSTIDTQAIRGYLQYLDPYLHTYLHPPANPASWQFKLHRLLSVGLVGTLVLLGAAFGLAAGAVILRNWRVLSFVPRGEKLPVPTRVISTTLWGRWRAWYADLLASPSRCGLLVLLTWQIVPLLALSHHSIQMYNYYLLVLIPGPFILIGILAAQLNAWLPAHQLTLPWRSARYAFLALIAVIVFIQASGTMAWITDEAQGQNAHTVSYNSTQDLQNVFSSADQLARAHHLHHIYIETDFYTQEALTYLAGQLQTPGTLSSSSCLLLPNATEGPAVLILGPAETFDQALLNGLASAQLISEVPHLGSNQPYRLYIVQPAPAPAKSSATFINNLSYQSQVDTISQGRFLTRWNVLRAAPAVYGTTYNYTLKASYTGNGLDGQTAQTTCSFSSLQPGEQLLSSFALPAHSTEPPALLSLSGTSWTTTPYIPSYGPFHFETLKQQNSPAIPLQSATGAASILVQQQNPGH